MGEIERYDVSEEWAHSGIIKAGDYCFLGYCVGNIGGTMQGLAGAGMNLMDTIDTGDKRGMWDTTEDTENISHGIFEICGMQDWKNENASLGKC